MNRHGFDQPPCRLRPEPPFPNAPKSQNIALTHFGKPVFYYCRANGVFINNSDTQLRLRLRK